MFRRQAHIDVTREWLFQTEPQAILVAASNQRRACRRAHGRVRVALQKSQSPRRDPINVGCAQIRASVAGYVGIAQIVGQNENNIGRLY